MVTGFAGPLVTELWTEEEVETAPRLSVALALTLQVPAAMDVDGQARPSLWTFEKGKARVFASILGHYTWTWEDPLFRVLALRGLAWTAGEPPERFESH